jgi:ABC-type Fe3+/spermidine/putrescine transport system ATPase subunit
MRNTPGGGENDEHTGGHSPNHMIRVDSIRKELGEFSLRGVSLQIERGEYFVVLGPTGSGKTVLIECIAGLNQVDSGRVFIDGEDVTDLPPELRRVGYVPQDYVLFPHLTVFENIAFALRLRRWDDTEARSRVTELAEMLHISHLLDRHPRTLSGGEQQRSALARALAFHPRVLLLDEPLSALDEGTRAELSIELSRISRELNTTVIHVCHNFEEAIDLGDRIAIVRSGEVIQVGTPSDIFRRPNSRFVARFVRSENIFAAAIDSGGAATDGRVPICIADGPRLLSDGSAVDGPMIATIRPEDISITATDPGPRDNLVRGSLRKIDDRGRYLRLYVDGDISLVAIMTRQAYHAEELSLGDEVYAAFPAEAVHLLPEDG